MLLHDYSSCHSFHVLPSPLAHIAMAWCLILSTLHVTNMSQLGQSGRGCQPSYRITTVSHTWQCTKCTRSALRLVVLPNHPPTGQEMLRAAREKDIHQVLASYGGWGPSALPGTPHAGTVCETPGNLPPGLRHNWDSGLSGGAGPGRCVTIPSSGVLRPLQRTPQVNIMYGKP